MEKQKIELEVQNEKLDPCDEEVITKIADKLQLWFGKPPFDQTYDSWSTFIKMKRDVKEDVSKYMLKFDTILSELKCSGIEITPIVQAIHLLSTINVNEAERRSILANTDSTKKEEIFENMKSSIRLLKGSLIEGTKEEVRIRNHIVILEFGVKN